MASWPGYERWEPTRWPTTPPPCWVVPTTTPGRALGYYASRGETPLVWGGQLSERLGLTGAVDEAGYAAVFGPGGARDPHLRTRLVRTRRPGMELVVSAHKSVAVLGLIGRAEDMHAILDAETDATLAHLESWFVRQGGRRGKAQRRTATGGLLWARTRHTTSRSGDPCPHDHVLVANVTEMLDDAGGWMPRYRPAQPHPRRHPGRAPGRRRGGGRAGLRHRARRRAVGPPRPLGHRRHHHRSDRGVLQAVREIEEAR